VDTVENKSIFSRLRISSNSEDKKEMSFVDHLEALRWHVVRSAAAWIVAIIAIFPPTLVLL
jgi:hypothetical protein